MNRMHVKILFFLLIFGSITFAQKEETYIRVDTIYTPVKKILKIVTVRTVPKFILHLNGSWNSGAMELTGHNGGFSRDDFFTGKNFGARHGFGVNLIGKLPLDKKGNFWLDVVTGFDRFQSDLVADNTEEGEVSYNSINAGVGAEYNFTPTHKVKYFIGANPLLSFISGDGSLINQENNRVDIDIESSFRMGYQIFLGLEYAFDKNFGLNLGLRFTHANLMLKKSEPIVQESDAHSVITLNDDAGDPDIQFSNWKQFAYFSANAGFSYFFGVKERRFKIPN